MGIISLTVLSVKVLLYEKIHCLLMYMLHFFLNNKRLLKNKTLNDVMLNQLFQLLNILSTIFISEQ